MASTLFDLNGHFSEHAVVNRISSYLSFDTVGFMNSIRFTSDILKDCVRNKREHRYHNKVVQWKNKGSFDIFNNISDNVTLV